MAACDWARAAGVLLSGPLDRRIARCCRVVPKVHQLRHSADAGVVVCARLCPPGRDDRSPSRWGASAFVRVKVVGTIARRGCLLPELRHAHRQLAGPDR